MASPETRIPIGYFPLAASLPLALVGGSQGTKGGGGGGPTQKQNTGKKN